MSTNIDTRITPALHPDNVKALSGYGDDTADVLAPTMAAFSTAYEGLRSVHEAREKAKTNPTWNEAQQVIQTQDLADRMMLKIAKGFDSTRANLEKGIEHIENQLNSPLETKAAHPVAAEIRAHVKALPTSKRDSFIREAIQRGDMTSASAVLGAPSYLSGMEPQTQAVYTRMWNEKAAPEVAKRLKVMTGAKEMIEQHATKIFPELEKAVGVDQRKVQALRKAKNAAEQAFILKDVA